MSVSFKRVLFREDPSKDFYTSTPEFENHVQTNYVNTGKILVWRRSRFLDDFNQTIEYETIYRDKESFDEALVDSEFQKNSERATDYNYYNAIRLLTVQVDDKVKEIDCDPTRVTPVEVKSSDF